MSDPRRAEIEVTLRRVRARLLRMHALGGAVRGLSLGLLLAALSVAALRALGRDEGPRAAAVCAAVGILAGAVLARVRRPLPIAEVAVAVDQRAGLREVVTTALELERAGETSPFTAPILDRALRACADVRPAALFPGRLPREWRWLAGGALLLAASTFVPPLGASAAASQGPGGAPVEPRVGRDVQVRARKLLDEARAAQDADADRLAREMETLGREIEKGRLTKNEALSRLEQQKDALAKAFEERKARAEVAARLEREPATQELAKAAKEGKQDALDRAADSLARKLAGEGREAGKDAKAGEKDAHASTDAKAAQEEASKALGEIARAAQGDASLREKARRAQDAARALEGAQDEPTRKAAEQELAKALGDLAKAAAAKSAQQAGSRASAQKKGAQGDSKQGGSREAAKQAGSQDAAKGGDGARDAGAQSGAQDAAGNPQQQGDSGQSGQGAVPQAEIGKALAALDQARARVAGEEARQAAAQMNPGQCGTGGQREPSMRDLVPMAKAGEKKDGGQDGAQSQDGEQSQSDAQKNPQGQQSQQAGAPRKPGHKPGCPGEAGC